MKQRNETLKNLQECVAASLLAAQARVEAAGESASFADRLMLQSTKNQQSWLEEVAANDELIPFGPRDGSEVSPHLLAKLEKQKSNGSHNTAPEVATAK